MVNVEGRTGDEAGRCSFTSVARNSAQISLDETIESARTFLSSTAKPNPYYAHVRRVSSSHYARSTQNDVALSVNVARYSIINFGPSFCIIPFHSILNGCRNIISSCSFVRFFNSFR